MDADPRLFVEIHPFEGPHQPHPHPIEDGRFDPALVYKVLGVYNPSETSECYFMLANPQRQIWFIPQRHLLAYRMLDSDEFFIAKSKLERKVEEVMSRRAAAAGEYRRSDFPSQERAGKVSEWKQSGD